jgi:membrane protein implicated in regulation of membrane protease activity
MSLLLRVGGVAEAFLDLPLLTVIGVVAAGIVLIFLAKLLRCYPVVFFGLALTITASFISFIYLYEPILGLYWMLFSLLGALFAGLWLYKNKRWAFWFAVGSDLALLSSAFFLFEVPNYEWPELEGDTLVAFAKAVLVPLVVFFAISVIGNLIFNLIVPKATHKDRNERKHLTNVETLIGQRVTIVKDKVDGRPQRGYIGDVDWAIEPLYMYESFKVGDVVKVVTIKGVTLMCTRDGKDYRKEIREKRKEEASKQRILDEEKRAKRAAAKAAKKLEAAKERARAEEAKAKEEEEIRKIKEQRKADAEKEKAELAKIKNDRKLANLTKKKNALKARNEKKAEEHAKKVEKAEKKATSKPEKVEAPKAKAPAKEKPVKHEKKEPVVKEKRCFFKNVYDLVYFIASIVIFVISLVVIILFLLKVFNSSLLAIICYVFFGLALLYLIAIFVLELRKMKQKQVEEKPEEPKEEPKVEEPKEEPKAEEPKVEEPKVEEEAEEPATKEKAEFVPFNVRLQNADDFLRGAYNELKSEVLSYGIKSRVSSTGDTFRLHTKAYVKMVIAGKYLKLYFALNPADYRDSTYPFEDASRMGAHKDTPFVFKIKSGLSIRRAKVLIADAAKVDGLEQGEVVPHDHAKDLF